MGWAKYFEDDLEIMFERQYMIQRKNESTVKIMNTKNITTILKNIDCELPRDTNQKNENKYLVCKDCGKEFLFSAKSQKYFESKGWKEPVRCKECREIKNIRFLMASSF